MSSSIVIGAKFGVMSNPKKTMKAVAEGLSASMDCAKSAEMNDGPNVLLDHLTERRVVFFCFFFFFPIGLAVLHKIIIPLLYNKTSSAVMFILLHIYFWLYLSAE